MPRRENKSSGVFYSSIEKPEVEPVDTTGLKESEVLLLRTVVLTTKIGGSEMKKQLTEGELKKVMNGRTDRKYLAATKRLIDKEYLAPMIKAGAELRRKLYVCGFRPSFLSDGSIIVPFGGLTYAINMIREFQIKREEMLEKLAGEYETAKLKTQLANPDLYREEDYPTVQELNEKFSISYSMLGLGLPAGTSQYIEEDVVEGMRDQKERELTEALSEIKLSLRTGFSELTDGLVSKVTALGQERRTFKQGFLDKWKIFLDTFDAKNLANDTDLKALVDRARDVLDGVSPDVLRNNIETKVSVEKALIEIKGSLDDMLAPVRRPMIL